MMIDEDPAGKATTLVAIGACTEPQPQPRPFTSLTPGWAWRRPSAPPPVWSWVMLPRACDDLPHPQRRHRRDDRHSVGTALATVDTALTLSTKATGRATWVPAHSLSSRATSKARHDAICFVVPSLPRSAGGRIIRCSVKLKFHGEYFNAHSACGKFMTKHIFVTGDVDSSLGKGLTASSLGRLLRSCLRGHAELDPINVDPAQ